MPEWPDVTLYVERLEPRILGRVLRRVRVRGPFLLRTVKPFPEELEGRRVATVGSMGKRIVIGLEEDYFLVLHLMIAGRLRWREEGAKIHGRIGLAAFDFEGGTLLLTEAGSKKRAALHVVRGGAPLRALDPGGLDVMGSEAEAFRAALARENHTLKRALTDPRILSGIGNAYSDEILHRARLSPFRRTRALSEEEAGRLREACRTTLTGARDRLRAEAGDGFPEKVTAFHDWMAVHGRYRKPCPTCGAPVQRIRHAENETNYCPGCQTGGRVLADRSLSRLLRDGWPRTLEELEEGR